LVGSIRLKLHVVRNFFLKLSLLRGGNTEESVEQKAKQTHIVRQNIRFVIMSKGETVNSTNC
jgi:hypothetical protein